MRLNRELLTCGALERTSNLFESAVAPIIINYIFAVRSSAPPISVVFIDVLRQLPLQPAEEVRLHAIQFAVIGDYRRIARIDNYDKRRCWGCVLRFAVLGDCAASVNASSCGCSWIRPSAPFIVLESGHKHTHLECAVIN